MLVDPTTNQYMEQTGDVTISWAPSPILATEVEPNAYSNAVLKITSGFAAGLALSLIAF